MKEKLTNIWKRYTLLIYLIPLLLLGIYLWGISDNYEEFGLNFTTELMGVIITVFIVDRLSIKRENNRLMPMKIIAYKESSLLFNRFSSMVFELYNNTIEETPPVKTSDFLKSGCINEALTYTDINALANTYPSRKIINHLANSGSDLMKRADKILDKYSMYLNPEVANLIHKCFIENTFISTLQDIPATVNSRSKYPYPDSLIFHVFSMRDEDIEDLVKLYELLVIERDEYGKIENGIRGLSTPEYISKQQNRKLRYRISDDKLNTQYQEFEKWKKEQQGE